MQRLGFLIASILLNASVALAMPCEVRLPLHDGRLLLRDVSAAVCRELHLPNWELGSGSIDVRSVGGSNLVQAMNQALGAACALSVTEDVAVLKFDADKLPKDCDSAKLAVRVFTAISCPEATAAQRATYGLLLPEPLDPVKPLVVLVHGLDNDRAAWGAFSQLLVGEGHQVAYFSYPSDQPLKDSAALLQQHMAAMRSTFPLCCMNIVAHSMGGIVARAYVEGEGYQGNVDRLILLGTPSAGSDWAKYRLMLEVEEHYHLWRSEPNWSPSWIVTDGLGEAGCDLKPGSAFLTELNARPRRAEVRYTIVAGSRHPLSRMTAKWADRTARLIPQRAGRWWGLRQAKNGLSRKADQLRREAGSNDGPVTIASTHLAGVTDVVIVPADHASLYIPLGDELPGAWETVRDRLKQ